MSMTSLPYSYCAISIKSPPGSWDTPTGILNNKVKIVSTPIYGGDMTQIFVRRTNGITSGNEIVVFDPNIANVINISSSSDIIGVNATTNQNILDKLKGIVSVPPNKLLNQTLTILQPGVNGSDPWEYAVPGEPSFGFVTVDNSIPTPETIIITGKLDPDNEFKDVTHGYTVMIVDGLGSVIAEPNEQTRTITVTITSGSTTYQEIVNALNSVILEVNGMVNPFNCTTSYPLSVYTVGNINGVDSCLLDGGEDHSPDTVTLTPLWHSGYRIVIADTGFTTRSAYSTSGGGYLFVPEEGDIITDGLGYVWEILGDSYYQSDLITKIPNPQVYSVNPDGTVTYDCAIRGVSQYHISGILPQSTSVPKNLISRKTNSLLWTYFNKSFVEHNQHDAAVEYNFRNLNPTVDLSGIRGGFPCEVDDPLDTMARIAHAINNDPVYWLTILGGVPPGGNTLGKLYNLITGRKEVNLLDAIMVVVNRDYIDPPPGPNISGVYQASGGDIIGVDTSTGTDADTVTIRLPGYYKSPDPPISISNNTSITIYSLCDWSVTSPVIDPGDGYKIRGMALGETLKLDFGARIHLVYSSIVGVEGWVFKL